jgi:exoribonuclease R
MQTLCTKNYKEFTIKDANGLIIKEFLGAKNANRALPGDIVELSPSGCSLIQRKQTTPIAGLLELSSKTKYGFTNRHHPMYLFTPFNESYPQFIVGSSERDTSKNRPGVIHFEKWTDLDNLPRGALIQLLDTDEDALSWTYTPIACTKYKGPLPEGVNEAEYGKRPLVKAFHIDPPGCLDVDDVLTIDYLDGEIYVTITISDVAAHIPYGHPLDARASEIAETFYQDGLKPRHMLPANLSEALLSLLPSEKPKLGLSLKFPLRDITQVTWFESAVETTATYTYESIYKNKALCELIQKVASALGEESTDSHKWIEAAMKFYNIQAAILLRASQNGLLRSHEAPDQVKLDNIMKINPELKFLAYNSAMYVPADHADPHHYGLEATVYTHATSPIRRYADLVNQRSIKAIINGMASEIIPVPLSVPVHLNARAKLAKCHDRDLVFIRALRSEKREVTGQILSLAPKDAYIKVSIYVNEWQQVVKIKYSASPEEPDTIVSKDEKTKLRVSIGQSVAVHYYADMTARNWKRRMILRIV